MVLVGHDWGGALAFDWAARHPDRVRGVAFFETIVRPISWSELGEGPRSRAEAIRGPQGASLVLDQDFFVRSAFTGGVLNPRTNRSCGPTWSPTPLRKAAAPSWSGPARCPSTASPPTSPNASRSTTGGWPPAPRRPSSCSPSTPPRPSSSTTG
ncbi:alpha/beta fold hydrolase [Nonomuraea antimicrobica]